LPVNILTKLTYDVTSKELVSFMITRLLALLKSHLSSFSRWSLTPAAKTNLFTKIYVLKKQ
ncbi:hypothetical protein, partial [Rossellomorea sp. BNER]|uniref:hypothetical protein n=1 Tax=Rossellomorea sp. BNER TaxID=2962031 RepID=UPI003AF2D2D8|nr:hypothetical protein [Rossellomorea sp. BNER]